MLTPEPGTVRSRGVPERKKRRNGMQMYVCTGIGVDIKEWNKAQRSLSAIQLYEQFEEGAKVHDLQMRVMKAVDALFDFQP